MGWGVESLERNLSNEERCTPRGDEASRHSFSYGACKWVSFLHMRKILLFLLVTFSFGCATPRFPSHGAPHRRGFFDRFVEKRPTFLPGATLNGLNDQKELSLFPSEAGLKWPLKTPAVTSQFGKRGGVLHEGLDLRARVGTPVFASQKGIVLYADRKIGGYGKMVIIRHSRGLATIYAHNSRLFVRRGQKVKQGQKIALSGVTGHARGPHLHFEIRKGAIAMNPLPYLRINRRPATLASAP
jgi:hypothetical protein